MYTDHHFPKFHVRPPTGFVNDPNGPVLLDGSIHIYYQYRPATDGDCPVFWGHASSPDAAHWSHHRAAISPEPGGRDEGGVWSGNTIAHDGILTAFYSAFMKEHALQSAMAADSVDGGFSFGPARQAVADPEADSRIVSFRDPFVWKDQDKWRMVIGAGTEDGLASARLYCSEDLKDWTFEGNLAELDRTTISDGRFDTGEMWECPQVIIIDGVTLLFVGCWSRADGIMQVMTVVGTTETIPMNEPLLAPYDQGTNFYAASVLPASPEGPLLWGWATEGRTSEWSEEADWSGMLTLPRRISVSGTSVRSEPARGMESLRTRLLADDIDVAAPVAVGAQFEIDAVLTPGKGRVDFRLRFSAAEHLDISVDRGAREVLVDRSAASTDSRAHTTTSHVHAPIGATGHLGLRIFVDGSILELFTSDGQCATVRFYPTTAPEWSLELSGRAEQDQIHIWELDPLKGGAELGPQPSEA